MHKVFRVGKYEENINFDKIEGYQNGGFPLKWGHQNFELLNH